MEELFRTSRGVCGRRLAIPICVFAFFCGLVFTSRRLYNNLPTPVITFYQGHCKSIANSEAFHHTTQSSHNGQNVEDYGDPAEAALAELCDQTDWLDGLWLYCHSSCGPGQNATCGGLNNARNRVQSCVRLAISAGAGVVLPPVTARRESALASTDADLICPELWFDIERLRSSLSVNCPKLRIQSCAVTPGNATVVHLPSRDYRSAPFFNETFQRFVSTQLTELRPDIKLRHTNTTLATVSAANPLWLAYSDVHVAWSYRWAGELHTIRKALFRALAFNETLLAISNDVAASDRLQGGNYMAVHLRAEYDWPAYWGTRDAQMLMQRDELERKNAELVAAGKMPVRTVYVSCGEQTVLETFRGMLEPLNYTVEDKTSLLADRPEQLALVQNLQWDQRGVVEFNVMVQARFWSGLYVSTMSSTVAYQRTMDNPEDFYETYVYPESVKWGLERTYKEHVMMKGNTHTSVIAVNGQDIMDAFP